MDETPKKSLQVTLAQLRDHDIGSHLLALSNHSQLKDLAAQIASIDLYCFPSAIKLISQHLNLTGNPQEFLKKHLEHLLWVHHREALWRSGRIQSRQMVGCRFRVKGKKHLKATIGFPTIIIGPMMLAYEDTLWISRSIFKSRELAIYGEGLVRNDIFDRVAAIFDLNYMKGISLIGGTPIAVRNVLRVLENKGVFLTYPDFVYVGHKVQYAQFLGIKWPFSSSFISICARKNNMLLPYYAQREGNDLIIHFEQPIHVVLSDEKTGDPRWAKHLLGATVAQLLEKMVLRNSAQWLLLSAVIGESLQRAT